MPVVAVWGCSNEEGPNYWCRVVTDAGQAVPGCEYFALRATSKEDAERSCSPASFGAACQPDAGTACSCQPLFRND